MNKIYKTIWIQSLHTFVVTSEKTHSKGKASGTSSTSVPTLGKPRTSLFLVAALFSAGDALAACNDPTSSSENQLYATGGSTCLASQSQYTGGNVGYVAGTNSSLTFRQPSVTISSADDNVWVFSVGTANGTPADAGGNVTFSNNAKLIASTTTAGNTAHALYIANNPDPAGSQASALILGDLTVEKGTGAAAIQNDGGNLYVVKTTTITTGDGAAAGTADGFSNAGANSNNTFNGQLAIDIKGNDPATSTGAGIRSSDGVITINNGARIRTQAGQGMLLSGGTINTRGLIDIETKGGTGIDLSGTTELDSQLLLINTTGNGASGIKLSDTSKASFSTARITTRGDNAHGIDITNSATNGSSLLMRLPFQIETFGTGSAGIKSTYNTANAMSLVDGFTIATHGNNAHGLDLQAPTGDFANWRLGFNSRISTAGNNASAIFLASPNGATNINSSATLQTTGSNSHGIEIDSAANGGLVVSGGEIFVGGAGSNGINANNLGGNMEIQTSSIDVANGKGIAAVHNGTTGGVLTIQNFGGINSEADGLITGIDVQATGNGSINIYNAGSIGNPEQQAKNYGIKASVADASAMLTVNHSDFIFSKGTSLALSSEGGFDITQNGTLVNTGDAAISLSGAAALGGKITHNGFTISTNTGVLSNVASSLTLENNGYLEAPQAIRVTSGAMAVTNTDTGSLVGTLQAAGGQLDLDNAGLWRNSGNSIITSVINSGNIEYTPPNGHNFRTITTNNYTGNNGQLNINTVLGQDNSLSDRLVINGGRASGTTGLGVTNASGGGDKTTANGIQVVTVQAGGTTASDAFALSGPVKAGAYEYTLIRRNDENWYLVSRLLNPTPNITVSEPENYRAETSLYSAMPPMATLYSAATMDSWHERIGGASDVIGKDNNASRLWIRLIGGSGVRHGDAQGIYGSNGPAFDYNVLATQIGGNVYRNVQPDGATSLAGLYLTLGSITGDVDHVDSKSAGRTRLDVYSFGGYWTHKNRHGAYVDVVAQGNYYETKSSPKQISGLRTYGTGYDVSIEGGLPIHFNTAWRLEPQLQLRTMHAKLSSGKDAAARVDLGSNNSLVGRAGLKLSYQSETLTAWGRIDFLNEFRGKSKITFSSLEDLHAVSFESSLQGKSAGLSGGIDTKLTETMSLYGAASYQRVFGDSRGHAFAIQGGLKMVW